MGDRLTFTKFKVHVYQVTGKAILVAFGNELEAKWLARSNIRSDDDRRMVEINHQLESNDAIQTTIHVVDWLVRKEGWKIDQQGELP